MKINENNYITELQKHNEKALLYVIDRYGGLLNSIIAKHLYAIKDCREECLNDVFLSIWDNICCFDAKKSSFKNWIAGIARYKSIDYLRKYIKEKGTEKDTFSIKRRVFFSYRNAKSDKPTDNK